MMSKEEIDAASYETLLYLWRFSAAGDSQFIGKDGEYFTKVMFEKRDLESDGGVSASKRVGWSK